jgi:hypothetical protein
MIQRKPIRDCRFEKKQMGFRINSHFLQARAKKANFAE